jgi:cellulose synthase/poly-beta-1,6-N-acetylglucosamine synthase-like glycosyltransferase
MAIALIIIASALLIYAYIFYPLLVAALAKLRPRVSVPDESFTPRISVIISAYNEEKHLAACLDSLLAQDYPESSVEILVGSDGSIDATNSILSRYSDANPILKKFLFESRRGKMRVLNDLVSHAGGDILFFVDADMMLSPRSFRNHARHYGQPDTGGVAGIYRLVSDAPSGVFVAENDYHSYEMWLRNNESLVSSTVGLSGGNYSIRKESWRELPSDQIHDDLFSVFTLFSSGKRLLFEPKAISTENFIRRLSEEFRRKARFSSRGFETLRYFPHLISPRAGFQALMIWSHKILRWLSPVLLLVIFLSTSVAAFYHLWGYIETLLIIELSLIGIAAIGGIFYLVKISLPVFRHLFWFSAMNVAFITGTFRYLFRLDKKHWLIAERSVYSVHDKKEARA